jgi:hypothetical protein
MFEGTGSCWTDGAVFDPVHIYDWNDGSGGSVEWLR